MKPTDDHRPGEPATPEPPPRLVEIADALASPEVVRCGITTTSCGEWALYLTVPAGQDVPIEAVERMAEGFPVVYEAEPPAPPVAWPARPPRRG